MAKGRSTLVLLAGILLLGAFIFIQETWRSKVPSKAYRQVQFFDLSIETLVSLQFHYTNLVVECVKENGVWMTGSAEQGLGRADVAQVQRLVAGLNSMGKGTTITAEQLAMRGLDASEYGLAEPALEISALDNKGRHRWLIGRKAPLADMVYAKRGDGDDIYTLPSQLMDLLPAQPNTLRDRILFAAENGARRIEIRGSGGFMQIQKDPKAGWEFLQPVAAPADSKAVGDLLDKLYLLRIEDFVAENVSDFSVYGLQGETRQISLGGAEGASRMLVIGDEMVDRPNLVYARRADDTSVFALKTDVLDLVEVKLETLRESHVLLLPVDKISTISVARGAETLELVSAAPDGWALSQPVQWAADPAAVAKLLEFWDRAAITEFVVTNAPVAAAEWTFVFGSSVLGETNRIEILPPFGRKDGLLIMRNGEPSVFQINLPVVPDSILDPLEYKSRELWQVNRESITKITLKKKGEGRQVVERQTDGTFAPEATNAMVQVDQQAVGHLLDELVRVSAMDYVAYNPNNLSVYGLAEPEITLQMSLSGTNQLGRVLLVGQEATAGFYAMVKGRDIVFLLDKPLVGLFASDVVKEPPPLLLDAK